MRYTKAIILICITVVMISCSQIKEAKQENKKSKIDIPDFFKNDSQKPEVLLLGVFHFKDAGADDYKPQYSIDIMSEERQEELGVLLDALAKYNPTQLVLEVKTHQQEQLDSLYEAYLNDNFELRSNEIFQIGFKLGKRLGIKKLIAGDIRGKEYEYIVSDFDAYKKRKEEIIEEEDLQERLDSDYGDRYTQLYTYLDSLKTTMSLVDYLLLENEDSMLSLKHGHYLLGSIGVNNGEEYPSADNLSGWWYNRNLRIVSNIRKSIRNSNERVLVIFGSGHMPIIKHALKSSPEINVVELENVFK